MGTAFIAVAGQHGSNAYNFYRMFPAASVLPSPQVLRVQQIDRIQPPSLDALLRAIARRRDREIVVVSHGVPTQLAIPVMRGIRVGLDRSFVQAILGSDSDASVARRLRTRARNITTLRTRIRRVHALHLTRLEFRACRVGQSRPTLEALRRLFGAASACAPSAFDGYGGLSGVRPTTDATILARWQQAHPTHQSFGSSPDGFYWVNDGSVDPPIISAAFAQSWKGVKDWVEAKFPSGTNHGFRRGAFYYHVQTSMLQNSSTARGHRTFNNSFIFPNDAGYRQILVKVP